MIEIYITAMIFTTSTSSLVLRNFYGTFGSWVVNKDILVILNNDTWQKIWVNPEKWTQVDMNSMGGQFTNTCFEIKIFKLQKESVEYYGPGIFQTSLNTGHYRSIEPMICGRKRLPQSILKRLYIYFLWKRKSCLVPLPLFLVM